MRFKLLLIGFLAFSICGISNAQSNKKSNNTKGKKNTTTVQTNAQTPSSSATARPVSNPNRPATAANPRGVESNELMEPEKNGGKPFFDVIGSIRPDMTMSFSPEELNPGKLSTLLYVAYGAVDKENRCYSAISTSPDAEIEIYVISREQIMKFDRNEHKLFTIRKVHFLEKLTIQNEMPVDAPLAIVYVCNPSTYRVNNEIGDIILSKGMNCGAIMQNVYLFCANEDLSCKIINIPDNVKAEFMKLINVKEAEVLCGQVIGNR